VKRRDFLALTAAGAAGAAGSAPAHAAQQGRATPAPHPNPPVGPRSYKRIATEEGFLTREVAELNEKVPGAGLGTQGPLAAKLLDIGEGRLAGMDRDGVDMQLLLIAAPGVQAYTKDAAVAVARNVNDEISEVCRRYPGRLAALTTIAPQDPTAAAAEFERGVRRLGMKGAVVNSHTSDEYFDNPKFWPILEAAEALNQPIYIHPRDPASGIKQYMGGWLTGAAFGYQVEVSTHVMRMIAAGVFDRFERIRFVIDHMGEALPFWLSRLDNRYLDSLRGGPRTMKRLPSEYFLDHFHITTSGMNYKEPFDDAKRRIGLDRILYATDHPFEDQTEAVKLAENLGLTEEEKKKFFQTNAERVFGL
jgi:2,3-dihydroxybenzoate decarboxylase